MVEGGSLLRSCTPTRGAAGSNPALSASFAPALAGAVLLGWIGIAAAAPPAPPAEDPHAGAGPAPAAVQGFLHEGRARLVWLNTWEARNYAVEAEAGAPFSGPSDWHGRVLALARALGRRDGAWADLGASGADAPANPAAFVELFRGPKLVYRGWLFAAFPMLFGPEAGGWKVRLAGITIPPAPNGDAHP